MYKSVERRIGRQQRRRYAKNRQATQQTKRGPGKRLPPFLFARLKQCAKNAEKLRKRQYKRRASARAASFRKAKYRKRAAKKKI